MRITAVIITYNEEENIERCLESIKWANEIIIVDSGSRDKTLQIAKKYTKNIYKHRWQGYSKQKNYGIARSRYLWVLSLDADEAVTPELKDEILVTLDRSRHDGYYLPRKAFFLGRWIKHCGWYPDFQLRIFKKGVGKFDENKDVHEGVVLDGKAGYMKNDLNHFPYKNIGSYFYRFNKYTTLAAENMQKQNRRTGLFEIMFHPPFTFFKMYMFKLGFLDGFAGFTVSVLSSFYNFVKYAKLWELIKRK